MFKIHVGNLNELSSWFPDISSNIILHDLLWLHRQSCFDCDALDRPQDGQSTIRLRHSGRKGDPRNGKPHLFLGFRVHLEHGSQLWS